MEKEKESPKAPAGSPILQGHCKCFHPDKITESYLIECKYKDLTSSIDLYTLSASPIIKGFTGKFEKQHQEIKSNSPPIYLSNSSLII